MKIQVLRAGQEGIQGYQHITVDTNTLDLSLASDNECDIILAPDLTDSFSVELIDQLIQQLLKKLRLKGELVLGGTDIRLFAKAIANGMLDYTSASKTISQAQSMVPSDKIRDLLAARGLEIQTVHMDGLHYEIKAKRVK